MTTRAQLEAIVSEGESETLELKTAVTTVTFRAEIQPTNDTEAPSTHQSRSEIVPSVSQVRPKCVPSPSQAQVLEITRDRAHQAGTKLGPVESQAGTKLGLSWDQAQVLEIAGNSKNLAELMTPSARTNRTKFRDQVLAPLLEAGLLEMTIPNKPRSPNQRYRTTAAGIEALRAEKENKR